MNLSVQTRANDGELSARKDEFLQLDLVANLSGWATWQFQIPEKKPMYSDAYFELLGYTRSEMDGSAEEWYALCHPDDQPNAENSFCQCMQGELAQCIYETRMRHKEGRYVWILNAGRIVEWSPYGDPLLIFGGCQNIEWLKEAERRRAVLFAKARHISERAGFA